MAYAYNPANRWLRQHQLSVNGKRDGIDRADLRQVAREMSIRRADELVDEALTQVARWSEFAATAGVADERMTAVGATHRLLK